MLANIEQPTQDSCVEPMGFYVSGWVWIADLQHLIEMIKVWGERGTQLLGKTSDLQIRVDVCAAAGAPPNIGTGFWVVSKSAEIPPGESFGITVKARLSDGRLIRIGKDDIIEIRALPAARDPLAALRAEITPDALGLEIGAHAVPAPGLTPYYTDVVAAFSGSAGRVDFISDGCALPLPDNTLDYLCASHVLEHLANPVAGIWEWYRVLKPGGLLYLVVPDKRFTFDHQRSVTPPLHLIEDFARNASADTSREHVDEFVYHVDWAMLHPEVHKAQLKGRQELARQEYLQNLERGEAIDIHFHTFVPSSFRAMLRLAGFTQGRGRMFDTISEAERYPSIRADGIALLLKKRGSARLKNHSTYRMTRQSKHAPALPLVCPMTLKPLQLEADKMSLFTADQTGRFVIDGAVPILLPARLGQPNRVWRSAWNRKRIQYVARLRAWLDDAAHSREPEPPHDIGK